MPVKRNSGLFQSIQLILMQQLVAARWQGPERLCSLLRPIEPGMFLESHSSVQDRGLSPSDRKVALLPMHVDLIFHDKSFSFICFVVRSSRP